MFLNAVGLGLCAPAVEPQVSYTHLLPALIVCGIGIGIGMGMGMGMFFAPARTSS